MISANPPFRRHSADPGGNRRDTTYSLFGFASPGEPLGVGLRGDEPGTDQLIAQILGQRAGIALIVHNMRRDQHEQLGAGSRVALGGNQRAEDRDVLEEGYAAVIIRGIV